MSAKQTIGHCSPSKSQYSLKGATAGVSQASVSTSPSSYPSPSPSPEDTTIHIAGKDTIIGSTKIEITKGDSFAKTIRGLRKAAREEIIPAPPSFQRLK